MTVAELRRLAEQLPPGATLGLDRATLLELTAGVVETTTYTVATLAAAFHRSQSTVRDWLDDGLFPGAYHLPGAKRPGAWRIPQLAVDAFKARGTRSCKTDAGAGMAKPGEGRQARRSPAGSAVDIGDWRKARRP